MFRSPFGPRYIQYGALAFIYDAYHHPTTIMTTKTTTTTTIVDAFIIYPDYMSNQTLVQAITPTHIAPMFDPSARPLGVRNSRHPSSVTR